jgi:hypothetical protein
VRVVEAWGMRKEELRLSQRDRDRLVVLAGIERGHWSQREGASQLGLSTRWARNLSAWRKVHMWKERRVLLGEMVMMDSTRLWFLCSLCCSPCRSVGESTAGRLSAS